MIAPKMLIDVPNIYRDPTVGIVVVCHHAVTQATCSILLAR